MQERPRVELREKERNPNERFVRRFRGFVSAALAATVFSCASAKLAQEAPPKNPDDVRSELPERDEDKQKEPIIAPPPAYGHRIVRAESELEMCSL